MYKTNNIQPGKSKLVIGGRYLRMKFEKERPHLMLIGLTPEGRQEVREVRDKKDCISIWGDLFDDLRGNGNGEIISPVEIGALVSDTCPIVAFDVDRRDDGSIESIGDVYYYERYQVDDEFKEMLKNTWIVFQKADTSA